MLLEHTKAQFNFEILETFEAGLELLGIEVKSIRAKKGKLEGAHVLVRGGEAYLVGASIPPYQPANTPKKYDAERPRRLLLTKKELNQLLDVEKQKGLTIVPLSVYNKGKKLKLSLAIAKGKKKFDKRETIKERETTRSLNRVLKQGR